MREAKVPAGEKGAWPAGKRDEAWGGLAGIPQEARKTAATATADRRRYWTTMKPRERNMPNLRVAAGFANTLTAKRRCNALNPPGGARLPRC